MISVVVKIVYKVLISDFEDTLIDEEDAIPLSTMLALDKIRNKKVAYVTISNNNFKSVLDYNKDFSFIDYIIVLNGAYIYDVNKAKALYKRNIAISIVKKIKKVFEDYNLCFYTLDWCNCTQELVEGDNVRKIGDFKVFSAFHKDNIFKVEIRCKNKKEQASVLKELEELNLDVNFFSRNSESKGFFVEIVMSECSRLDAVQRICKARKTRLKDSIIVTCSEDDSDILKKVGLAYAVDNASNKVKKMVDKVTLSNLDKGVERVIMDNF